jgi:menaquinone-dependent protoporphyrinogen IX oxidase
MKGLVAYYSKFGNGKIVAEAIASGLREAGHDIVVTNISENGAGEDFDFVVVSSPTRAGHMIGPAKRFIGKQLKQASWKGKPFIAVGTGFRPKGTGKFDKMGAKSAEKVYDALQKAGLKPIMDAQKFFIEDMKGPLEEGEQERALELGRSAGQKLQTG